MVTRKQNDKKRKRAFAANKSSSQNPLQRRKLEVTFDKEKRKEYLANFSKRKRERRCFGLAIQKVKDRKVKLQERKNRRKDAIEIENAFVNKEDEEDAESRAEDDANNDEKNQSVAQGEERSGEDGDGNAILNTKSTSLHLQDEVVTKNRFGGEEICVTTTYGIPEDSEEEELLNYEKEMSKKTGVDEEQRSFGSVQYYLKGIKETCGGTKKKGDGSKKHKGLYHKGKYGAQNMQGIAKGKDFKIASMALRKANASSGGVGVKRKGKGRHSKKK